ncbi:helix-turn-helix domain-containing protein [Sulfobacillus thermosulfidooxidans]|uniref:helix-turn-helix domain-containing protein n=1 Tax=Sulfobacillus thermosulfidooxidans TaxID=28034 RepID=UPI0006B4334D|nr:helix-turn-helix transcriptional regulator [Sulfobacillus thermosulfidooxidans]
MESIPLIEDIHAELLQAKHHGHDLLKRFGVWMRQHRERRGLTVTELAHRIGVSQVLITRVERGNAVLSESKLSKIFEILEIHPMFWRRFQDSHEDPNIHEQAHMLHAQLQTARICCPALMLEFGWYIRHYRHQKHWTETELAAKVGVTKQTICGVEQGKMVPSATLITHLAEQLNMSLRDWRIPSNHEVLDGPRDLFWHTLTRLWGGLADEDKMVILQLIGRLSRDESRWDDQQSWNSLGEKAEGQLLGLDP